MHNLEENEERGRWARRRPSAAAASVVTAGPSHPAPSASSLRGAFRFSLPYRLPPLPALLGPHLPPLPSAASVLPPSSQWDVSRASAAPGCFSAAVT